ncbi:hypothetical protein C3L29_004695 [Pseudomonas sp. MWU12-2534b]|nr:hypothetical protein C3L29_004695 [Pseudomonas sp. MWU12-2534b]
MTFVESLLLWRALNDPIPAVFFGDISQLMGRFWPVFISAECLKWVVSCRSWMLRWPSAMRATGQIERKGPVTSNTNVWAYVCNYALNGAALAETQIEVIRAAELYGLEYRARCPQ